jgi:predicted metal-dependent HD superfamily phosphohydrolase
MKTFDDILPLIPDSLYRNITNLEYLRGLLDNGYLQPWRYYHNYGHIETMLTVIGRNTSFVPDRINDLVVAILFHDVVYDIRARAPENEVASFKVAGICGPRCIRGIDWTRVEMLICATTHDGKAVNPLNRYMADVDLSTFALPYEEFREVNNRVRMEYECFFTPELVRQGRLDFLKTFSQRPQIFYHDMIFSNDQAFKNIQESIEELEGR